MNIAKSILSQGQDSAVALLHRDTVLTYRELRAQAAVLEYELRERSCVAGDRVGIFSENSHFFVGAYLGTISAGCVAVPFQTEIAEASIRKIVADAGIRVIFVSRRFWNRLRPWAADDSVALLPEPEPSSLDSNLTHSAFSSKSDPLSSDVQPPIPSSQSVGSDANESPVHSVPRPPPSADGSDLAALMFTSGSTGDPKGVMITHRNIECNTRDIIAYLGLTPVDRAMVVLPFHYCFGLSLLHTLLMAGGSFVLNNDFRLFPEAMVREMREKECTGLAGVPSTYQILLRKSRFREMAFPKLRWFQQAGGKLPNAYIQETVRAFPRVRYFLMYGQTEATARLSYLPPERLGDKLGSVGRGLLSTALEVLKPDGSPVIPGSDETGEIVASGDNISPGYWNDPEETAKYFRNGRLHTGDIARVDADGFIFIVEREREMIKSGGNRVSAKEVEDVIAELSEVVEVAVIGTPHELLGEAIKAFVVVAPATTITPDAVRAHCRKRLGAYKTPEEVSFLKNLPHNSSGKVLKLKLKEMAEPRPLTPVSSEAGAEVDVLK